LCLKNIPSATHVTDLVQYLESHLAVTVERAIIKPPIDASSDYCFAHVELSDAQDGARIIDESAILEFSGRDIHVVLDACIPPDGSITEKTSTLHYEKQELLGPAIAIDASQEEVMTKSEDVWYNNKGTGSVLSDESSPGLKEKDEALHLLPATTNDSSHVADITALDVIVPKEVTVSNYIGDDSSNIFGYSNEVVAQIDAVQATDSLAVGGYPQLRELFERQISVLERQLEDVIASKDFQGAVLIQSNIDSLKQAPTVAITQSVVVMLNEELDEAIAKRDFSSAAIIQSYIENVEKYITSTAMKMVVIP
jgi:protein-arginine kinase activator protein McsA